MANMPTKAAKAASKAAKAAPKAATAAAPIALIGADGKALVSNATGKGGAASYVTVAKGQSVVLPLYAKQKGEPTPTPVAGVTVQTDAPYAASVVSTRLSDWPPIGAVDLRKASALDRRAFTIGTVVGGDRAGEKVVVAWFDAVEQSKTTTKSRLPTLDAKGNQVAACVAFGNARLVQ
jgi:hypothetical protein